MGSAPVLKRSPMEVGTNRTRSEDGQVAYDALILDARNRQALAAVRSLGRRGLRVAGLENGGSVPAFASRWCQQQIVAPSYAYSEQAYLARLEEVLDSTPARVLIPSSDGTIALLRAHREVLQRRVRIALAEEPALQIAVNKQQSLDVARSQGLSVPHGVSVSKVNDVRAAIHEIGLPAIIKPAESWMKGMRGGSRDTARLVTTADEARQGVEELLHRGAMSVLWQQFLAGDNESVCLLYARGKIHARYAMRTVRTCPPIGGTTVMRQSIAVPDDTGPQAEHLVRAVGIEGYSNVQFRRDHHGRPYLMEINPRLNNSTELAIRAGVDFPYLLYQWANGDTIDVVNGYRIGIWQRYLAGDIATTAMTFLQRGKPGVAPPTRAVRDFCSSFFTPAAYDSLDWRDPIPSLLATCGFVRYALRYLLGKGVAVLSGNYRKDVAALEMPAARRNCDEVSANAGLTHVGGEETSPL
jgi:predicted ATP-grasp superfamily ATP-dependent carboligase